MAVVGDGFACGCWRWFNQKLKAESMTSELNDLITLFLKEKHPDADLADVTASLGILVMTMIVTSVPTHEQEPVYEGWKRGLDKAFPKLRTIVHQGAG